MTFTTMTIGNLCVSPYNARKNKVDANAIEGMAESLLNRGQLYPLVVHRMEGSEDLWGAFAGGRRYRAFKLLIEQGRLPADHPIEVITRDISEEGELRDLSVAENLVRLELRPYEIYAAVARANACGRGVQDIADTNGQTLLTVRRWIALGNIEPTIFAALENEEINSRQAEAFAAAADDHALQLHAFRQVMQLPASQRGPDVIRRLLKVGDDEAKRLLRFVGEGVYREAGGRYHLDLFADEADQRGRVVDEGLLMELVEAKLATVRDRLRKQAGRELRFEKEYPRDAEYGGVARGLEIVAEPKPRSAADGRRLEYLENEMTELEAKASKLIEDPDTPERAAAIAAIDVDYVPMEAEAEEIRARRRITLPDGDVFGTLVIEPDGDLEIRWWWGSRKAKRAAEKPAAAPAKPVSLGPIPKPEAKSAMRDMLPQPYPGGGALDQSHGFIERQKANAVIRQDHGVSADGVQVLRALRREALRCGLLDNADQGETFGRDYAVWCLLRFELCHDYGTDLGARRLGGGYDTGWQIVQPHIARSIAGGRWEKELKALRAHPCMARPEQFGRRGAANDNVLCNAFRAYLTEEESWKTHVAAILAGLMLERSLAAPGYEIGLHDLLAAEIGLTDVDVAAYVEPNDELIDLFPRAQRLAMVEPHVDRATFAAMGKAKAGDLTGSVARALRKAKGWVHPLMRFPPAPVSARSKDQKKGARQ